MESLNDHRLISRVNSTAAVLNFPVVSSNWSEAQIGCCVRDCRLVFASSRVRVYCKCFGILSFVVII